MTVGELLARITSAELTAWHAYEQVTGALGPARADAHAAMICHAIAQAFTDQRLDPADFLPVWDTQSAGKPADDEPAQTWQEQLAFLESLTATVGGEDLRGHPPVLADPDRRRP